MTDSHAAAAGLEILDGLDRLANLRDAGAVLRPGVLYRSEAPQPGDHAPSASSASSESSGSGLPWPPRTVLDLREPHELVGPHPLAGPSTTVVTVPMLAALQPDRVRHEADLAERYVAGVEHADRWLPELLAVVAAAPAPILVHCAAGKDRTGIATAVLLRLAGAHREDVIADFVLTSPALDAVHRRLRRADPGRVVPPGLGVVRQDAIEAVLDALGDPDHARELARRAGVADSDLAAWTTRMASVAPFPAGEA